ncbi:hypothetical protein CVV65_13465 [Kyrpidia spormannii]|uniref:CRISPR type III-associated protein domain-containing protein n=1 Tax=Kyrpidia spormannii TaxID=2055160 RepID=A0A2K8N8Z9_9BACL|nr:RAMP superfamily CRISPR-associated protein [Kyrpidia spormannii]ATY85809.1 hypothetical protein CVV65_13465 [Kyrpidia spormannii]
MGPFHFYSVDPHPRRQPPRPRDTLDRNLVHGRLYVVLETLTPLIVGTGGYELRNDRFVRAIHREGGIPVIPGSTLKGVLRSYVELLSKSCILFVDGRSHPNLTCSTTFRRGAPSSAVCPACQLFGIIGNKIALRSLISVGSFRPTTAAREEEARLPQLYRPRLKREENGTPCRKVYNHGDPKYILEAVPKWKNCRPDWHQAVSAGVKFSGFVDFENCTPEEVGLLVLAMGAVPTWKFQLKVGYAKPAFFGSVQLDIADVQPADQSLSSGRRFTKETLWNWAEQYLQQDDWNRHRIEDVSRIEQFEAARHHVPQNHEYLGWNLEDGVYGWVP